VQVAIDAVWKSLCATGQVDQIWLLHPCPNGRALAIDALWGKKLADQFPGEHTQLIVYADDDHCGLIFQASRVKGKLEYPAFSGGSMSARRRLAHAGALK
jgi:hypothetical protein